MKVEYLQSFLWQQGSTGYTSKAHEKLPAATLRIFCAQVSAGQSEMHAHRWQCIGNMAYLTVDSPH